MILHEIFFGLFVIGLLLTGLLIGRETCACGYEEPEPIVINVEGI
jgi:hypothetical protein